MLKEFKQHIDQNFSFLENSKLLIAISGGIDSVVLTHLIHKLGFNFSLCHCNFKLRGNDSDADEAFVKNLGKELNTEVFTTSFETESYATENKISIQVAARDLRYEWFYSLVERNSFDFVLTAHNSNDNLETFLINLTRGTGLEGLTGIPPINKKIARPLLASSREDIEVYASENNINWREDQSNASSKYVRNKIRHQVIPILKEINPSVLNTFQNTLNHLNESEEIMNDRIQELSKEALTVEGDLIKIDISKIDELKNKKAYLYQLLHSYGFTEWNDVLDLLSAQSGKFVTSRTHRLIKDRKFLLLTSTKVDSETYFVEENTPKILNPIHLAIETVNAKGSLVSNKNTIYLDKDLIEFPLTIRRWQKGDVFYPTGMNGKKKLSKFFKDEKYSIVEKENTWLLCSGNNILWIIGKRSDRRVLANTHTSSVIKAYITH
ncbi:MAG: tRNA lysidine(34) synthetase TilS [Flavobacteriaceae bacterium]